MFYKQDKYDNFDKYNHWDDFSSDYGTNNNPLRKNIYRTIGSVFLLVAIIASTAYVTQRYNNANITKRLQDEYEKGYSSGIKIGYQRCSEEMPEHIITIFSADFDVIPEEEEHKNELEYRKQLTEYDIGYIDGKKAGFVEGFDSKTNNIFQVSKSDYEILSGKKKATDTEYEEIKKRIKMFDDGYARGKELGFAEGYDSGYLDGLNANHNSR